MAKKIKILKKSINQETTYITIHGMGLNYQASTYPYPQKVHRIIKNKKRT